MGQFAWLNLLTRPLRTFLALVGLSVPILGVLGLFWLITFSVSMIINLVSSLWLRRSVDARAGA